jgi:hypothetical protein
LHERYRRLARRHARRFKTVGCTPVDPDVHVLLIFGAAQWAWTWFRPGGRVTAAQAGSALVDMVLGGLLVDRTRLPTLASPTGAAAKAVREALQDVAHQRNDV